MAERDPVMITARLSASLQEIARALDSCFAEAVGERVTFSLLVWGVEDGPQVSYVSNAQRGDVLKAMEELIGRWKRGEDDMPAHFQN